MSTGPQGPGADDPTYVSGSGGGAGFPPPPPPGYPRFEGGAGAPSHMPPPVPPVPPVGHTGYPDVGRQAGGHDRAAEAAAFARRHLRTPETKEFFKSSEFVVWCVAAVFTLIAAAISDEFGPRSAWLYVTILSSAYIVSRGLAKAGSRRGDPERP